MTIHHHDIFTPSLSKFFHLVHSAFCSSACTLSKEMIDAIWPVPVRHIAYQLIPCHNCICITLPDC